MDTARTLITSHGLLRVRRCSDASRKIFDSHHCKGQRSRKKWGMDPARLRVQKLSSLGGCLSVDREGCSTNVETGSDISGDCVRRERRR